MENVLEAYRRPYDPRFPLICMDELNKQLTIETQTPLAAAPGRRECFDYEKERNGKQAKFDWQFRTDDARTKLKHLYPKIKVDPTVVAVARRGGAVHGAERRRHRLVVGGRECDREGELQSNGETSLPARSPSAGARPGR